MLGILQVWLCAISSSSRPTKTHVSRDSNHFMCNCMQSQTSTINPGSNNSWIPLNIYQKLAVQLPSSLSISSFVSTTLPCRPMQRLAFQTSMPNAASSAALILNSNVKRCIFCLWCTCGPRRTFLGGNGQAAHHCTLISSVICHRPSHIIQQYPTISVV